MIMVMMMMMMMMIDIKGKGLEGGEKSIDYLFFPQTRRCRVNTHIICELKIFFEKFEQMIRCYISGLKIVT